MTNDHYIPNWFSRRYEWLIHRGRLTPAWLRRHYLWILIPAGFFFYLLVWVLITWELPGIVDRTLALLSDELDKDRDSDTIRGLAYAIAALLGALAGLAFIPYQLVKTWVNERQATTAEQGHITDRLTKAIEQLGAEKNVKRATSITARTVDYRVPTGTDEDGNPVLVEAQIQQRFGAPQPTPEDAQDIREGEWETVTETVEETVPNLEVRLGAIYALERIAEDSERDHIPVMKTLCAYIRENAKEPRIDETATAKARDNDTEAPPAHLPPRVDIQAALSVIAGRSEDRISHEQSKDYRLDLRGAEIARADLTNARLQHAQLVGANLTGARLGGADLTKAGLVGANLTKAGLGGADLTKAGLGGADLTKAGLGGADLTKAGLVGANLTKAGLGGADLTKAGLVGANLTKAGLGGANLTGAGLGGAMLKSADLRDCIFAATSLRSADFTEAKHLTAAQVKAALGVRSGIGRTRLPEGLDPPEHWFAAADVEEDSPEHRRAYNTWLEAQRKDGQSAADLP